MLKFTCNDSVEFTARFHLRVVVICANVVRLSLAPVGHTQGGPINLLTFLLQSEGENNYDILMNHLYSSGIHG